MAQIMRPHYCSVPGCSNNKKKFPYLSFHDFPVDAELRARWVKAIRRDEGPNFKILRGSTYVCRRHFPPEETHISASGRNTLKKGAVPSRFQWNNWGKGRASMDYDSPDFVPSVFTSTKPIQKKKGKGKRQHKPNVKHEDVLMETESELSEETKTAPTQVPKEEETWTKESETSTELSTSQTTCPSKSSVSFKLPPGISKLDKMSPFVLIKPLHLPAFKQNELDNRSFIVSELGKCEQLKKEKSLICENCGKQFPCQIDFSKHQCDPAKEPHFPCNICDRYFNTSQKLKRHKLLHVRDGRKCTKCGVLFCRRHNHIFFQPKVEPITENVGIDVMAKNRLKQQSVQSQSGVLVMNTQGTIPTTSLLISTAPSPSRSTGLLSKTSEAPPPASGTKTVSAHNVTMYYVPVLLKPISVQPPPPVASADSKPGTSFQLVPPQPDKAVTVRLPHPPPIPELPDSLKLFSPQYLTSALLEVKRNYDYILSYEKERNFHKKDIHVKEENCEWPLTTTDKQVKKKTAYDLEIEI
ncbi:uncharacterized protein LOC115046387 isoform X2 [Echeneis naucrates]|uniref:uncharacterized protein LOC115046387 isoform X2 n=1 Tax=Echeneis naucrates TaxID=173247 RepID=UPI0011140A89|nr:uncharacterized protein LOC115046387 isoform X2 [Echeneis naucrates]